MTRAENFAKLQWLPEREALDALLNRPLVLQTDQYREVVAQEGELCPLPLTDVELLVLWSLCHAAAHQSVHPTVIDLLIGVTQLGVQRGLVCGSCGTPANTALGPLSYHLESGERHHLGCGLRLG